MTTKNDSLNFNDRLNKVFNFIKSCFENDNLLSEDEFQKIQNIKKEFEITSEDIYGIKGDEVERIVYFQLNILLLDDVIDINERKEIEFYKSIFGWSDNEIHTIMDRVIDDKKYWSNRTKVKLNDAPVKMQRDRSIPESIKKIIWDRDGGKCVLCGSTVDLEFDHDIPFSKGGSNSTENIRVLCRSCNRKKSDKLGLTEEE